MVVGGGGGGRGRGYETRIFARRVRFRIRCNEITGNNSVPIRVGTHLYRFKLNSSCTAIYCVFRDEQLTICYVPGLDTTATGTRRYPIDSSWIRIRGEPGRTINDEIALFIIRGRTKFRKAIKSYSAKHNR